MTQMTQIYADSTIYFRKATTANIPEIKSLWVEVFGDSDGYIHHFITHFGIENCYVCEINRKIVAMAFAISTTLSSFNNREIDVRFPISDIGHRKIGKSENLKYIHACATHPDFQEQGIMKKLLDTIYKEAYNENVAGIFLQAINQSLANYYRKLGFEDFFFRDHSFYYKHNFNHKGHEDYTKDTKSALLDCNPYALCAFASLREKKINIIPPKTYQKKRVQKLKNHCFVNWNADFFQFINETGTQFCEYKNTIFSFKTDFNNIIVDEWLGNDSKEQIARLLFEHLPDFDVVHIRSMGNGFCCGQMKWCNASKENLSSGYFAFAME